MVVKGIIENVFLRFFTGQTPSELGDARSLRWWRRGRGDGQSRLVWLWWFLS